MVLPVVGWEADAGASEPDPLGRPSVVGFSEESEEHDVRAANTTATSTPTTLNDFVRTMVAIEPCPAAVRAGVPQRRPQGVATAP